MSFQLRVTFLALCASLTVCSALKCTGVLDSPNIIEEDVDFSVSFCTLRGVTVKGSVIGIGGAALVSEGAVTILGSVVLVTEAVAILGDNLEIRGEFNVQGPIGKNPRDGIDKVMVGRATINRVVIRNEAFVFLNGSDVGGVLITAIEGSGARGLRTRSGGRTILNQKGGILNLQGTNVTEICFS